MEFWLITDGEKEGPLLDFELRSRIRSGELAPERKVWFSTLDQWTPLGEVELFADEFSSAAGQEVVTAENVEEYLQKVEEEEQEARPLPPTPPPVPAQLHLWRRFGGRWFDYLAYSMLFLIWVVLSGNRLTDLTANALFAFVFVLPWIFFEALLLHYWGTTPGKWLVGLKVVGPSGDKLSPGPAFMRTCRVMILGMGFGQPILRELCHLVAFWMARKKKIVLWDTATGNRLERVESSPAKWVLFGGGLTAFLTVVLVLSSQLALAEMPLEERVRMEREVQERLERILGPLPEKETGTGEAKPES
ncbi:RDD family protein [Roseibacillus ishigakijimensis]|uniref:RDD family protein n=1 Tax=Roseibacillus ishigakijimensis TaxID=454146 RepID=A0A934VKR6_9BACT|nr:RDD family protein [Roseibacillus ishigakijimensis]MBK1832457.1 RDD family protein [Roseibacillus ishigakijimensis]